MKSQQIVNKVTGTICIPLDDLIGIQGSLKVSDAEMIGKLRQSLIKNGIIFPLFVWESPNPEDKRVILDGGHRLICLRDLRSIGWEIPPIPVVKIQADTVRKAKKIILLLNSYYSKVTKSGMSAFVDGMDWKPFLNEINIPGVKLVYEDEGNKKINLDPVAHFAMSLEEIATMQSSLDKFKARIDETNDARAILCACREYAAQ